MQIPPEIGYHILRSSIIAKPLDFCFRTVLQIMQFILLAFRYAALVGSQYRLKRMSF
jgi:hypothetical protein